MRRYRHLSAEERDGIARLCHEGVGANEIARRIGRDKSTVSREIARNGRGGRYGAAAAQRRADARRAACRPRRRLDDPALRAEVASRIRDLRWSPQQAGGRMRREAGGACVVSFSTTCRSISRGELDPPGCAPAERTRGRLRRRGRRRRRRGEERRGKIRVSHELAERPAEADARERVGDWEADTVRGGPSEACLVTLVDRRTRLLVGGLSPSGRAADVADAEVRALAGRPLETITPDRGKEFASHADVSARLGGVQFYFCQPHRPWQRGTNENTNGLIREFFPKGTNFSGVSEEEVERVFALINDRPRKVLGYRTASEAYREVLLHSA